ncbi:hypothetical protein BHE97_04115 [Aeromicrobium sp. PE09-221]|uniref:histidine kinase n=1 Tax=Aeromicrobium sp. PE09-221 TaxID=1898043 RepID=UPI000B3EC4F7|nr:histidine kinase [Aeromicrobium sp. PE09-221]OUZ11699.1 hypothetical protein BHE97_04115 [Aeromicrobium sp. PE09-221]
MTPARSIPRAVSTVPVALIVAAWLPAIAAVATAVVAQQDWSPTLRLVVTAIVYGPVAAIALGAGRRDVALILGGLAVTSGLLAFAILLGQIDATVVDIQMVAIVARQPEIAALAILPWLLVRHHPRARRLGVGAGVAAIALDLGIWTVGRADPVSLEIVVLPLFLALGSFLAAGATLATEWRRYSERRREALAWSGAGAMLLALSYARIFVDGPSAATVVGDAGFVLAQGLLPVGIVALAAGSGRRSRPAGPLFTTMVWVQSLAFAISLYLLVGVIAVASGMSPALAGACAAAALALVFSSMIGLVRRRTGRMYYGDGTDVRAVFGLLGERIAGADEEAGVATLAESLREVWGLSSVTITPAHDGHSSLPAGEDGYRLCQELVVDGRSVGAITLTGPDPMVLDDVVMPLLHRIGPLLGVAVLLAQVNHEVAATRYRTIRVRAEERRLLRRELRDELAPALAGIAYSITAARRYLGTEPGEARRRIAAVRDDVADQAEAIRRLARSMLPAALDAGDLDGALRELAAQFTDGRQTVVVSAAGTDTLESKTQLVCYLLAAEAVSHSRRLDSSIAVELQVRPSEEHAWLRIGLTGDEAAASARESLLGALGVHATELGATVTTEGEALTVAVPR